MSNYKNSLFILILTLTEIFNSFGSITLSKKTSIMKRSSFYMRSIPGTYNSAYSLAISSSIGGSNLNIRMPSVILVNPFSPANIGSISRVMLNFGLTDLRVVSPECDILSEEARYRKEYIQVFTNSRGKY